MGKTRDFGGWATRFNIKCADGRTIKPGAFDECDGQTVPLVWDHKHDSPLNVLGHALLHCKDEGVYADIFLNDTTQGKNARELVDNGDIKSLSIYANQLKHQNGSDVVHGIIREVSLVLAGANPGAFIDTAIAHSEDGIDPEEAVIFSDDDIESNDDESLEHAVGTNAIHYVPLNSDVTSPRASYNKSDDQIHVEWTLDGTRFTDTSISGYERNSKGNIVYLGMSVDWCKNLIKNYGNTIVAGRASWNDERLTKMAKNMYNQLQSAIAQASNQINGVGIRHSEEDSDMENEHLEHADGEGKKRTVQDVIDTMNEEQKKVLNYCVSQALMKADENSDKGEEDMKHNVFDNDSQGAVLAHSMTLDEQSSIIADMKKYGSLKESFLAHKEEMGISDMVLQHGTDIERSEDKQAYMVNDPSFLFPEAKSLNNPPAWIKRNTDWVAGVLGGTKHVPFSRIKSVFADITEDEARAKGYLKGQRKTEEVFTLLKRSTDPQTIYKKQKMDRDDVIDITDFDVVAWIKGEMRMMLDEEIARAILIGDGRSTASNDHIKHDHIRPIWTDDDLFTIKTFVEYEADATDDDKAKAYIRAAVKARKNYKGSGNPVFFTTEDVLTDMLLLEDNMGHRLYKSEAEVASAMRVSRIVTVQVMEGQQRTVDSVARDLVGIIVNLSDYTVGADKGGAVSMFDDFDIDYNQMKYLIETRCSGALTVPYSAIVIESAKKA